MNIEKALWLVNFTERCKRKYWKDYLAAKEDMDGLKAAHKLDLYNIAKNEIAGMVHLLRVLGYYVEYDWPSHRGEWFLPTPAEREDHEDWLLDLGVDG